MAFKWYDPFDWYKDEEEKKKQAELAASFPMKSYQEDQRQRLGSELFKDVGGGDGVLNVPATTMGGTVAPETSDTKESRLAYEKSEEESRKEEAEKERLLLSSPEFRKKVEVAKKRILAGSEWEDSGRVPTLKEDWGNQASRVFTLQGEGKDYEIAKAELESEMGGFKRSKVGEAVGEGLKQATLLGATVLTAGAAGGSPLISEASGLSRIAPSLVSGARQTALSRPVTSEFFQGIAGNLPFTAEQVISGRDYTAGSAAFDTASLVLPAGIAKLANTKHAKSASHVGEELNEFLRLRGGNKSEAIKEFNAARKSGVDATRFTPEDLTYDPSTGFATKKGGVGTVGYGENLQYTDVVGAKGRVKLEPGAEDDAMKLLPDAKAGVGDIALAANKLSRPQRNKYLSSLSPSKRGEVENVLQEMKLDSNTRTLNKAKWEIAKIDDSLAEEVIDRKIKEIADSVPTDVHVDSNGRKYAYFSDKKYHLPYEEAKNLGFDEDYLETLPKSEFVRPSANGKVRPDATKEFIEDAQTSLGNPVDVDDSAVRLAHAVRSDLAEKAMAGDKAAEASLDAFDASLKDAAMKGRVTSKKVAEAAMGDVGVYKKDEIPEWLAERADDMAKVERNGAVNEMRSAAKTVDESPSVVEGSDSAYYRNERQILDNGGSTPAQTWKRNKNEFAKEGIEIDPSRAKTDSKYLSSKLNELSDAKISTFKKAVSEKAGYLTDYVKGSVKAARNNEVTIARAGADIRKSIVREFRDLNASHNLRMSELDGEWKGKIAKVEDEMKRASEVKMAKAGEKLAETKAASKEKLAETRKAALERLSATREKLREEARAAKAIANAKHQDQLAMLRQRSKELLEAKDMKLSANETYRRAVRMYLDDNKAYLTPKEYRSLRDSLLSKRPKDQNEMAAMVTSLTDVVPTKARESLLKRIGDEMNMEGWDEVPADIKEPLFDLTNKITVGDYTGNLKVLSDHLDQMKIARKEGAAIQASRVDELIREPAAKIAQSIVTAFKSRGNLDKFTSEGFMGKVREFFSSTRNMAQRLKNYDRSLAESVDNTLTQETRYQQIRNLSEEKIVKALGDNPSNKDLTDIGVSWKLDEAREGNMDNVVASKNLLLDRRDGRLIGTNDLSEAETYLVRDADGKISKDSPYWRPEEGDEDSSWAYFRDKVLEAGERGRNHKGYSLRADIIDRNSHYAQDAVQEITGQRLGNIEGYVPTVRTNPSKSIDSMDDDVMAFEAGRLYDSVREEGLKTGFTKRVYPNAKFDDMAVRVDQMLNGFLDSNLRYGVLGKDAKKWGEVARQVSSDVSVSPELKKLVSGFAKRVARGDSAEKGANGLMDAARNYFTNVQLPYNIGTSALQITSLSDVVSQNPGAIKYLGDAIFGSAFEKLKRVSPHLYSRAFGGSAQEAIRDVVKAGRQYRSGLEKAADITGRSVDSFLKLGAKPTEFVDKNVATAIWLDKFEKAAVKAGVVKPGEFNWRRFNFDQNLEMVSQVDDEVRNLMGTSEKFYRSQVRDSQFGRALFTLQNTMTTRFWNFYDQAVKGGARAKLNAAFGLTATAIMENLIRTGIQEARSRVAGAVTGRETQSDAQDKRTCAISELLAGNPEKFMGQVRDNLIGNVPLIGQFASQLVSGESTGGKMGTTPLSAISDASMESLRRAKASSALAKTGDFGGAVEAAVSALSSMVAPGEFEKTFGKAFGQLSTEKAKVAEKFNKAGIRTGGEVLEASLKKTEADSEKNKAKKKISESFLRDRDEKKMKAAYAKLAADEKEWGTMVVGAMKDLVKNSKGGLEKLSASMGATYLENAVDKSSWESELSRLTPDKANKIRKEIGKRFLERKKKSK